MSLKPEDIPYEEGGDLEDEIGIFQNTADSAALVYNNKVSTASPQGHALPMLQFVHRGAWLGEEREASNWSWVSVQ